MNGTVVGVITVLLSLAAFGFLYRMLRGPSMADRVVGFDGILSVFVVGILVHASHTRSDDMLPVVLVLSLLAFAGTALFGRFLKPGDGRG
ncbi:MAG: monovalent cation/H+ antiporter complex subunit F [Microthrixaceae bacterium]